jgi:hypothetical protein
MSRKRTRGSAAQQQENLAALELQSSIYELINGVRVAHKAWLAGKPTHITTAAAFSAFAALSVAYAQELHRLDPLLLDAALSYATHVHVRTQRIHVKTKK